jgi:hypothetical protein
LDAKLCCWTKILREELIRIKIVAALAVSSKNRWLDKDSIALKFRERLFAKLIFYRHEKSASTTYICTNGEYGANPTIVSYNATAW